MKKLFTLIALLLALPVAAAPLDIDACPDPGVIEVQNGLVMGCYLPPDDPSPPQSSTCPLTFSSSGLDQDINPVDGVADSQNKACTSPSQGSDCAWFKEPQNRSAVTGQIFGYPAINGPFPAFSVNYSVWINAQPGTQFDQLTINADNVCVSNVDPADLVVNGSNVYLDGVLQ